MLIAATWLLASWASGIAVEGGGDPSCVGPGELTAELERRLPELAGPLALVAQGDGWRLRYEVTSRGAQRSLNVHLARESGRDAVERAITFAPDGCGAAISAVGIIVERHVREVGWSAGGTNAPAALVFEPAPVLSRVQVVPFAGPALQTDAQVVFLAQLGAQVRWPNGWLARASTLLLPRLDARGLSTGEAVSQTRWPVRVGAGWSWMSDGGRINLGALAEVVPTLLDRTAWGVENPGTRRRVGVGFGASVQLSYVLSGRWWFSLDLARHDFRSTGRLVLRRVGGERVEIDAGRLSSLVSLVVGYRLGSEESRDRR